MVDSTVHIAPETWRPVPGASRYEVSDLGRLRSLITQADDGSPYIMSLSLSDGYLMTRLRFDNGRTRPVKVHRLVCAAFHGPRPSPRHCALHWNDCKADNRAVNLRWGTRAENLADARRNGSRLAGPDPKSWGRGGKLTVAQVRALRRVTDWSTLESLAEEYGVSPRAAYGAARRLTYRWVGDGTADQERERRAVLARRERQRAERSAEVDLLTIVALERVAPPAGQRRRTPHSPAASAPRSKGSIRP